MGPYEFSGPERAGGFAFGPDHILQVLRARKGELSCCKADCEVFRDLVFGWEIGISPELNRIIPEREREDYFDLLLDPCKNCPKRRSHIDPRTWCRIPPSCSGTRSRRFQEVLDGK